MANAALVYLGRFALAFAVCALIVGLVWVLLEA